MKARLGAGVALLLLAACATTAPADAPLPPGVNASVEDLAFVSGSWELVDGENRLLEQWNEPAGNSLTGSFRWIKAGELWMSEFLLLREEEGGVTLRFRHFSDELTAWEPTDAPLTLRLVELTGTRARFRSFGGEKAPWEMIFERPVPRSLVITLRDVDAPEEEKQVFEYERASDR